MDGLRPTIEAARHEELEPDGVARRDRGRISLHRPDTTRRRRSTRGSASVGPSASGDDIVAPLHPADQWWPTQLDELEMRDELYDDFVPLEPFQPSRVRSPAHAPAVGDRARATDVDLIEYGPLAAQPRDLPGRHRRPAARPHVHGVRAAEVPRRRTRARCSRGRSLLNRVWGYDYYGGARTVDVHVRRLRSKLGEEHAGLIQTIRSVGYSFGRSRWV